MNIEEHLTIDSIIFKTHLTTFKDVHEQLNKGPFNETHHLDAIEKMFNGTLDAEIAKLHVACEFLKRYDKFFIPTNQNMLKAFCNRPHYLFTKIL